MARGAFELELKFCGAPARVAALARAPLIASASVAPGQWRRLKTIYYDTADADLEREGVSLRIREHAGARVQTVKRATAAGAVVREEFETGLTPDDPFPKQVADADINAALQNAASRLRPTAQITIDRWTQPIAFRGSRFDIAIDLGAARADSAIAPATPIAEIEIEFTSGDMADLFAFARALVDAEALRLAARTKLETATRGDLYHLGKQTKPDFDPDAPAIEALQAMLAAVAVRVVNAQAAIIDVRAPDSLRQMRVALRRFRAVERTFRRAVKTDSLYALTRRARVIAQALGPARDLDVFLEETLPDLFSRIDAPSGADALRARAEAMRAAAWAEAHAVIADPAFTHFALDLVEAGVLAPWRVSATKRGRGPLRAFAPVALDKALRRARRVEASMDRTVLAARHPLRIALKKQRYAAQMLARLYPKARRKPYMAALSRLQGALGRINDAVLAQEIAARAAAGGGPDAMRAAGLIAGFKTAEANAAAAEIDRAWETFINTEAFWRDDNALDTDYTLP